MDFYDAVPNVLAATAIATAAAPKLPVTHDAISSAAINQAARSGFNKRIAAPTAAFACDTAHRAYLPLLSDATGRTARVPV
jgi:hypothetical protein